MPLRLPGKEILNIWLVLHPDSFLSFLQALCWG